MARHRERLAVHKAYKLFIGGKFARGENGSIIAARNTEETCRAIIAAHQKKIYEMRSEAEPPGRNAALICKIKACLARLKFWRHADVT